jgi:hypothetical protein
MALGRESIRDKRCPASRATVKLREPAAQSHGPEREICQRHRRVCPGLDGPGYNQKQSEIRLGDFALA